MSFLLPLNSSFKEYKGFISIDNGNFEYGLSLVVPQYRKSSTLSGCVVTLSDELKDVLSVFDGDMDAIVAKKLEQSNSVGEFVNEMEELVDRVLKGGSVSKKRKSNRDASFYTRLASEIQGSKELNIVEMSEFLDELKIASKDSKNRAHVLSVTLPPDYPKVAPLCLADLPHPMEELKWDPESSTLLSVQQAFVSSLSQYQKLWDELDDLDRRVWVISGNSSRSSLSRRIVIESHCYLQIQINDIEAPRAYPTIKFVGSDKVTQPLIENLNQNVSLWNNSVSLVDNLQKCLKLKFRDPPKENEDLAILSNSCSICYEFHLENESVPDLVCENERCKKAFHRLCLYDWLRSIQTTKISFSTVFGQCPECEKNLSFQIPSK